MAACSPKENYDFIKKYDGRSFWIEDNTLRYTMIRDNLTPNVEMFKEIVDQAFTWIATSSDDKRCVRTVKLLSGLQNIFEGYEQSYRATIFDYSPFLSTVSQLINQCQTDPVVAKHFSEIYENMRPLKSPTLDLDPFFNDTENYISMSKELLQGIKDSSQRLQALDSQNGSALKSMSDQLSYTLDTLKKFQNLLENHFKVAKEKALEICEKLYDYHSFVQGCVIVPRLKLSDDGMTLFDSPLQPRELFNADKVFADLTQLYGNDLVGLIRTRYLGGNFQSDTLTGQQIAFLFYGIALDVRKEHLAAHLKKELHECSEEELIGALNHFRRTPEGIKFHEHFQVPLKAPRYNVQQSYVAKFPQASYPEKNCVNTLQILVDLESYTLWQGHKSVAKIELSLLHEVIQFLKNPLQSTLFRGQATLNGTVILSLGIALLTTKSCFTNEDNRIAVLKGFYGALTQYKSLKQLPDDKIDPLIHFFEEELTGKQVSSHTIEDYILAAQISPFQKTGGISYDPLEQSCRDGEYFARKVAYTQKFYFLDTVYENQKGELDPAFCKHHLGTLLISPSGRLFEVIHQQIHSETFACQMLVPAIPRDDESIPVKLLFQGTPFGRVKHLERSFIDSQSIPGKGLTRGPGWNLWKQSFGDRFFIGLESTLINLRARHPEKLFHIELNGHSLGGSDAQNCAGFLFKLMRENEFLNEAIDQIVVKTYNTAGIPLESSDNFNKHVIPEKLEDIIHVILENDVVLALGETKLGYEFYQKHPSQVKVVLNWLDDDRLSSMGERHSGLIFANRSPIKLKRLLDGSNTEDHEKLEQTFSGIGMSLSNSISLLSKSLSYPLN